MYDRLMEWAGAEEAVRAVLLLGSRASDSRDVDDLSDYDLLVYVDDPAVLVDREDWPEWWGPILLQHRDERISRGNRITADLVLYEDGTRMDFTIAPVAALRGVIERGRLPAHLEAGYRVLLDKDGIAAELPEPGRDAYIPERPDREEYEAVIEEFWWEAFYVAKNLLRRELLPAKYSLDSVMKLRLLRRLLEWKAGIESGWSATVGAFGRGLGDRLDDATWAELGSTYVGPEPEENWEALFATTRLFSRVARSVGEELGFEYPERLDRAATERLLRLRKGGSVA